MVGRVDQWGPRLQLKPGNLSRIPRTYITAGATNPTQLSCPYTPNIVTQKKSQQTQQQSVLLIQLLS